MSIKNYEKTPVSFIPSLSYGKRKKTKLIVSVARGDVATIDAKISVSTKLTKQ